MIETIIFDLDGTLFDTAPDLAYALNTLLDQYNRPHVPYTKVRAYASTGSRGLLHLGFGITESDPYYFELRDEFFNIYEKHLTKASQLFEGVDNLLNVIEKNNLQWAVVTNKLTRFALPLLQHFGLDSRYACLIGGDHVKKPKPAPDSLLLACETMSIQPEKCIYVGDAHTDILAAKNSAMRSIAALYGYIPEEENPEKWQADYYIDKPAEIINLIEAGF